jgi:hypothetical protein
LITSSTGCEQPKGAGLALLITCDTANSGQPEDPVDLFGVGDVHRRNLLAYVELDEDDLDDAENSGLTLEAEGLATGREGGILRLLLREFVPGRGRWLKNKLLWQLRGFPPGSWRISVRIGGAERAYRIVGVGEVQ